MENFKKTFIMGLVAFALVFALMYVQKTRHNSRVENWPSTEGVIEESVVRKLHKTARYHYKPWIVYSYVVNNKEYKTIYYDHTSSGYLKEESALKITNRFPEGKKVVVHYNPKDLKDSILADLQ